MDEQMKKGALEMCILYLISKDNLYGYEIMRKMEHYYSINNESTFYAILRRLKKEGHTETYMGSVSKGPTRKYYRITETGKEYLKKSIEDWNKIAHTVKSVFEC